MKTLKDFDSNSPDAVILPGTVNISGAVDFLKDSGLFDSIKTFEGFIFAIHSGRQIMTLMRLPQNNSRVSSSYTPGKFKNDEFRNYWLNMIRSSKNYDAHDVINTDNVINDAYNSMAETLKQNLDVNFILRLIHHEGTKLQPE